MPGPNQGVPPLPAVPIATHKQSVDSIAPGKLTSIQRENQRIESGPSSPREIASRSDDNGPTWLEVPIAAREPFPSILPPSIRVTIGRVEVKATMSPVSFPRPASALRRASTLTLDDYLKRRSGGKR